MLSEMTPRQFKEWQVFEEIEPFGDEWQQAANIAWAALNAFGKTKSKPSDFMPHYTRKPPPRRKTPEEMLAILNAA